MVLRAYVRSTTNLCGRDLAPQMAPQAGFGTENGPLKGVHEPPRASARSVNGCNLYMLAARSVAATGLRLSVGWWSATPRAGVPHRDSGGHARPRATTPTARES